MMQHHQQMCCIRKGNFNMYDTEKSLVSIINSKHTAKEVL